MKTRYLSPIIFLSVVFFAVNGWAHCEIPCGIYDDEARMHQIYEHITTIEKSVASIEELGKEKNINYNQLVRWIDNKEAHAHAIQEIASQYFLTQRIKFDAPEYDKKLAALHQIIVYAMKCKQTVDKQMVEKLHAAAQGFEKLYFGSGM